MSYFLRLRALASPAGVRGIDEHPSWLMHRLLRARIRRQQDGLLLMTVDAEDTVGMHSTFAQLAPRLVTSDGREIPLEVVEHTRDSGFPVRCVVRPASTVTFDAIDNVRAQKLRLSFGGETKDLEITNAAEGS